MIKDAFDGLVSLLIAAVLFLFGAGLFDLPAPTTLTDIGLNAVAIVAWVWAASALAVAVANAVLIIREVRRLKERAAQFRMFWGGE